MKALWISLGIICLILGFIGVFLPLLPTTPFALLAAFCFSKGSDDLHRWLLETKMFGPLIKDWEDHGVIRLRIKKISTLMISLLFGYTLIFVKVFLWIKLIVSLTGLLVLWFIWTRPSTPTLND
ncbi:MAG: uncharacterized membrane protein YbaN (DUF454 family) [Bacteriovoracaceae bacterium]|jgi:uncharacterized membrane protein YbaN (DUF454 family)